MDAVLARYPLRELVTASDTLPLLVERERALYGAWYEFFPRSEGTAQQPHGTFRTAARRLPAIAGMGFDVVYLPPIHPIGHTPQGPQQLPLPGPTTSACRGRSAPPRAATTPSTRTWAPWRTSTGSWSRPGSWAWRWPSTSPAVLPRPPLGTEASGVVPPPPNRTIAYAENPPKKYQDIYPIAFDADLDGLIAETVRVLRHWMAHGVRIFRVDNPHTKPVVFWERVIADVNRTDPDVIFLAEAFTRPAMMHTLAQIGFQQSYTYFTWRTTKDELTEYLTELSGEAASYMRPNFFANTPDILHGYLQHGSRPAFEVRAVLAATLSPTWGIYSGYELCENTPLKAGSEEYLDSEKYQLKPRDWDTAEREGRSLSPLITRLNTIRRRHPALHRLRNIHFHHTDNDALIAYSKRTGQDTVVVVVNLDPHHAQEATVSVDIPRLGLERHESVSVHDELAGEVYRWSRNNYVRLEPGRGARACVPRPANGHLATNRRVPHAMTVNEPVQDTFEDTPAKDRDPEWFERAVFYEVLVRSFQDSNGDGVGDLKGLTAKLDYLQWLGVDCLWLPPFFKSPLRDGGYDVSDYTAVLPEFGDLADFVEFMDAAHHRGMRVIIDFVMNHTSDQHPWFQESRNNPDGPYGDYYMWADDDKQYQNARIIFVDTEASNWTFDPVRQQYFFHRSFSHQPDLTTRTRRSRRRSWPPSGSRWTWASTASA
ncbi:Alpha-1,4-glucan:maltose-1-phosphate maltosyltransferase [Streptomyces alboniger]